jgi:hypothetical protein
MSRRRIEPSASYPRPKNEKQSLRSTSLVKNLIYSVLCAAALLVPTVASAGPIQHREVNQQQRIYRGVQNGSLTGKEYSNLQRREQSIAAQRYRDVHDGNGLTRNERLRLNNRLDNTSQAIYRDKHDNNSPRAVNQQQRIYAGVQNGSLTGKEYSNLQRREQSIAAQRYRDVHDGGGLTAYERQRLNNRLDNTSQAIYREKHD